MMTHLRKPRYDKNVAKWLKMKIMVCLFILFTSTYGLAEEEILSLEGARIRGNQELPNVLYLIPWKPPKVYSLDETSTTLSSKPQMEMLDRSSFKRLVNYHKAFKHKNY